MFRASTAHLQAVRCMYVANGTTVMGVSVPSTEPYHLAHTYTLTPEDGLLMPETCTGILIQ
jgi:hypothetical protein